jgi:ADP-heptose:LPS heptosyltransferase
MLAAMSGFDAYIGNDSGPTHLAASQGLPTLCICSGTNDPVQWAPLGPAAVTIQRRMSCSPCYLRDREDCPYGVACLEGLSVDEVWEALGSLLPTRQPGPVDASLQARAQVLHRRRHSFLSMENR